MSSAGLKSGAANFEEEFVYLAYKRNFIFLLSNSETQTKVRTKMNIILMGCEYVGKSTLAKAIGEWIIEKTGMPYVRWHDHFVLPQIDNHLVIRRGNDESIVVPGENKDPITEVEEEEFNDSLIRNRIVLDTTGNSPSETFIDFSQQIESKLTPKDHNRLVTG